MVSLAPAPYTATVFRPWLRVARPDEWTGSLVRVGLWPVYLLVVLAVSLATIPASWLVVGFGSVALTRLLIGLVALYLLGWVRALAFSLLPRAVVQYGRRLWFRHHGRRVMVRIGEIVHIDVEQRPPPVDEVFIVELGDGAVYDLCPVHWSGAQRIYAVLARKVRRARLRATRRAARAERRR